MPSTVATTPGLVIASGIQTTATTTAPISTVSAIVSTGSQEGAGAEHLTTSVPEPSTKEIVNTNLNTNLTENLIEEAQTEEVQPALKETGSESDDTSGLDSDSDNSVVEVAPPGVVVTPPRSEITPPVNKGENYLNVSVLEDVTSPARELKSPSKEEDVTPKVGMAASPSEALRTPSRDKAATPSEQVTTSKN